MINGLAAHGYRARVENGSLVVLNDSGSETSFKIEQNNDMTTCCCYRENEGILGGWYNSPSPHPMDHLADCINRGIMYFDVVQLPTE
jgi:hypothetical protein